MTYICRACVNTQTEIDCLRTLPTVRLLQWCWCWLYYQC